MATESALILTEEEWEDLAMLLRSTLVNCHGPACEHHADTAMGQRLRALAKRIIEGAE